MFGSGPFQFGMRLEALDRLNPRLICVATIIDVEASRLKIHFDGWNSSYDYWCEYTSVDIHPIGYCKFIGKELQPPKGSGKC